MTADQHQSIKKIGKPSGQLNLRTIVDDNEMNDFSQGYHEAK